jgi:hypothetical protein
MNGFAHRVIKGLSALTTASVLATLLLASVTVSAQPPTATAVPTHVREAYRLRFENGAQLQRAMDAQERHSNALLQNPGIIGTAVGWAENEQTVVKVYIDFSASAAGLPTELDGIPVVVEQTGRVYALNVTCEQRGNCDRTLVVQPNVGEQPPNQRDWHPRPVPIGVSTGHIDVTAGTLACRVSNGCHLYALSNAHVYANENAGIIGDNILQPGAYDGGINPDDTIGTLYAFVPIVMKRTPATMNRVDAAIAAVTFQDVGTSTRTNGYGMPKAETLDPAVGMDIMKYGRSSAQTYGYIDAINAIVNVSYTEGTARFIGQIVIKSSGTGKFSIPGDSGSLVVASGGVEDRKPVGLLFASGTGITIANPINEVLRALNVVIDGE